MQGHCGSVLKDSYGLLSIFSNWYQNTDQNPYRYVTFNRITSHHKQKPLRYNCKHNYLTHLTFRWGFSSVGDRTNIQYSLMGYGIPVDLLPLTDTGNIKTKNLLQWIKVRKALDESIAKDHNGIISHARASGWIDSNNIECPGLNDVIFRSGKNHMSHPGKNLFR